MREEDLSIGYETWARPRIGIKESHARIYGSSDWPEEFRLFAKEEWRPFKKLSLLEKHKSFILYQLAKTALELPGDFVECGCFQGGISYLLGDLLKQRRVDKRVYLCDAFDSGLPRPNRHFDKAYREGGMSFPLASVRATIRSLGLQTQCVPVPGLFSETLKQFSSEQRFAFVHLDSDLYQGTKDCLDFLNPRLSAGAPVIVDDYYDESHGVMHALNEFAEANEVVIHLSVFGQAYWIKGEGPEDGHARSVAIGDRKVWMATDAARNGFGFLPYLREMLRNQRERLERFIDFCQQD